MNMFKLVNNRGRYDCFGLGNFYFSFKSDNIIFCFQEGTKIPQKIRDVVKKYWTLWPPGVGFIITQLHNIQYEVLPGNLWAMPYAFVEQGKYRN